MFWIFVIQKIFNGLKGKKYCRTKLHLLHYISQAVEELKKKQFDGFFVYIETKKKKIK